MAHLDHLLILNMDHLQTSFYLCSSQSGNQGVQLNLTSSWQTQKQRWNLETKKEVSQCWSIQIMQSWQNPGQLLPRGTCPGEAAAQVHCRHLYANVHHGVICDHRERPILGEWPGRMQGEEFPLPDKMEWQWQSWFPIWTTEKLGKRHLKLFSDTGHFLEHSSYNWVEETDKK